MTYIFKSSLAINVDLHKFYTTALCCNNK